MFGLADYSERAYHASHPTYGPTRFEAQPAAVRRRGRKGKALRGRKASRRAGRKAGRKAGRGKSAASRQNRKDYRRFLAARSTSYGPVKFETQPTWVRRRGRKGKAAAGATRKERRAERRALARSTSKRGGRKSARRSAARSRGNRQDYRRFLSARSTTYGPVPFSTQPKWVRRRGRKSTTAAGLTRKERRAARRAEARSSTRSGRSRSSKGRSSKGRSGKSRSGKSRSSKSRSGTGRSIRSRSGTSRGSRKAARKANRAAARASRSSRGKRGKSGASRVLTYNSLMQQLRGTKMKAWVCVGKKRTGCGGGRKGSRGSRQFGVLRP